MAVTSSTRQRITDQRCADAEARHRFADCRARIDGVVRAHYGARGTLRLHRAAFGLDLLRAPLNVLLAPLHILMNLVALLAGRVGLGHAESWLQGRRILLDTDVGRAVIERVVGQLLDWPLLDEPGSAGRISVDDPLGARLLQTPALRLLAQELEDPAKRTALGQRMARSVRDYAGTRGAVAETTVAIATLCAGALLFRTLTPGLVSMAPSVADALATNAAVSRFPLGHAIGTAWYGLFPTSVPAWALILTLMTLALVGAVFAAFAGIVADPVQRRLGIHHRRLHRLVNALEAEALDGVQKSFSTPEHYYARLLDLVDAAVSVLRVFRS